MRVGKTIEEKSLVPYFSADRMTREISAELEAGITKKRRLRRTNFHLGTSRASGTFRRIVAKGKPGESGCGLQ